MYLNISGYCAGEYCESFSLGGVSSSLGTYDNSRGLFNTAGWYWTKWNLIFSILTLLLTETLRLGLSCAIKGSLPLSSEGWGSYKISSGSSSSSKCLRMACSSSTVLYSSRILPNYCTSYLWVISANFSYTTNLLIASCTASHRVPSMSSS